MGVSKISRTGFITNDRAYTINSKKKSARRAEMKRAIVTLEVEIFILQNFSAVSVDFLACEIYNCAAIISRTLLCILFKHLPYTKKDCISLLYTWLLLVSANQIAA